MSRNILFLMLAILALIFLFAAPGAVSMYQRYANHTFLQLQFEDGEFTVVRQGNTRMYDLKTNEKPAFNITLDHKLFKESTVQVGSDEKDCKAAISFYIMPWQVWNMYRYTKLEVEYAYSELNYQKSDGTKCSIE